MLPTLASALSFRTWLYFHHLLLIYPSARTVAKAEGLSAHSTHLDRSFTTQGSAASEASGMSLVTSTIFVNWAVARGEARPFHSLRGGKFKKLGTSLAPDRLSATAP